MVTLFIVLVMGALAGCVMLVISASNDAARVARHSSGFETAQGRVLTAIRKSSGKSAYWAMTYEFSVEGVPIQGNMRNRERLAPGTTVSIGFLPSRHDENWAVGYEPKPLGYWAGPLTFVIASSAVWLAAWRISKQRQLLACGRPAIGHANGISKMLQGKGGRRYRWQCEFQTLSGARQTVTFETRHEPPARDVEVIVVYDPDRPERATAYPDSLVQIELG